MQGHGHTHTHTYTHTHIPFCTAFLLFSLCFDQLITGLLEGAHELVEPPRRGLYETHARKDINEWVHLDINSERLALKVVEQLNTGLCNA